MGRRFGSESRGQPLIGTTNFSAQEIPAFLEDPPTAATKDVIDLLAYIAWSQY